MQNDAGPCDSLKVLERQLRVVVRGPLRRASKYTQVIIIQVISRFLSISTQPLASLLSLSLSALYKRAYACAVRPMRFVSSFFSLREARAIPLSLLLFILTGRYSNVRQLLAVYLSCMDEVFQVTQVTSHSALAWVLKL